MFAMIVSLPLIAAGAVAAPVEPSDEWFVIAHYEKPAQLQAIASQFQHLIVDQKTQTVRTEATSADIAAFRAAGFTVEIDTRATASLRAFEQALRSPGGLKSIPGYSCYRTVEETHATMNTLVQQYPGLVEVAIWGPAGKKVATAARDTR